MISKLTCVTYPLLPVTTSTWRSQVIFPCLNERPRTPRHSSLPVVEQPRHQQNCPILLRWLFSSLVYSFFYFSKFRLSSCPNEACWLNKKVIMLVITASFNRRLALLGGKFTKVNRRRWLLSFSLSLFPHLSWFSAQRATLFNFRDLWPFLDIVVFGVTTR